MALPPASSRRGPVGARTTGCLSLRSTGKYQQMTSFSLDASPLAACVLDPGAGESASRREALQELSQFIVSPRDARGRWLFLSF